MSKQLIHTVKLKFFTDDNGTSGISHEQTCEYNTNDETFDAFWDGVGIFHDVFEHWFEYKHEYFLNDFGMNRAGECAAMGAALYYYQGLGVMNRTRQGGMFYRPFTDDIRMENEYPIKESLTGYSRFGHTFECMIPDQDEAHIELECVIDDLWESVRNYQRDNDIEEGCEDGARVYRNSLTKAKVRNSYRWGYHMAEALVPRSGDNNLTLTGFIDYFNQLCKDNDAKEMVEIFDSININLYSDKNEWGETCISWEGELISNEGDSIKLDSPFNIDEYIESQMALNYEDDDSE